jgi:ferredoxin
VTGFRITIDELRCCSSGQCVLAAPDLFDQRDEDGIGVPLLPTLNADQCAQARDAASHCPGGAISVQEA